jgi:hypothetical protein
MGRPPKPTPERYCQECGKRLERKRRPNGKLENLTYFNGRKFCDLRCTATNFGRRHSPDVKESAAHHHARQIVPKGPCNRCGNPLASDVHHRDHNYLNNAPENLERLCRSCHKQEHASRGSCVICGLPHVALGYCKTHYRRFKKHGDPLIVRILKTHCHAGHPFNEENTRYVRGMRYCRACQRVRDYQRRRRSQ